LYLKCDFVIVSDILLFRKWQKDEKALLAVAGEKMQKHSRQVCILNAAPPYKPTFYLLNPLLFAA
jgi:hypothetical protein